jgi:hypothetical protein
LRGIAILGVFFVHLIGPSAPVDGGWFGALVWTGWFGVPLFFMLSGFVLCLPFAAGRVLDIRSFYGHRLARLYPLYIIAALLSLFIYADSNTMKPSFWMHMLEVLTVSYYFIKDGMPVGNGPLWSLAIEFYMSALFPLLALAIIRWSALRIAIGFMLVTALLKFLFIGTGLGIHWDGAHWDYWWFATMWKILKLMQGLTEFSLGMWLAILWKRNNLELIKPYAPWLFLGAGLALLWLITLQPMNHEPFPFGLHALFFPVADSLLALVVASALALPKGILHKILTCWPLQIIGAMCFSIYVWHMPMMGHLGNIALDTPLDAGIFSLFSLAAVLIFSAFSYRFIEFPHKPWREVFLLPPRQTTRQAGLG